MDDDDWLCSVCGDEYCVGSRVPDTDIWLCEECWKVDREWLDLILMVKEAENEQH